MNLDWTLLNFDYSCKAVIFYAINLAPSRFCRQLDQVATIELGFLFLSSFTKNLVKCVRKLHNRISIFLEKVLKFL